MEDYSSISFLCGKCDELNVLTNGEKIYADKMGIECADKMVQMGKLIKP